jgi:inhibitor of cysteine peptidase
MKKSWFLRVLVLAVVACLVLTAASCGKKKEPVPTTEESSESITVNAGQNFTVTLDSNQTTGFTWQLAQALDANLVQYVGKDYVEPADTTVVGAPGKEIWQFQALAEGKTTIVLQYSQAWDTTTPPAKQHTVNLTINKTTSEMSDAFNIQVGQTFTLSLDSNQSTGSSWTMVQAPDAAILKLNNQTYVASTSGQVGAPGKEVWKFQGLAAGTTSMVLQYQQAGSTVPDKKDTVKVTVTKVTPVPPATPKEYRDQKIPIKAAVGEVFIIILPVSSGTGYQWVLTEPVNAGILTLLGEEYQQSASPDTGAPGAYYYTFKAAGKGTTVIKFGLMAPGGLDDDPVDGANFNVTVQ